MHTAAAAALRLLCVACGDFDDRLFAQVVRVNTESRGGVIRSHMCQVPGVFVHTMLYIFIYIYLYVCT